MSFCDAHVVAIKGIHILIHYFTPPAVVGPNKVNKFESFAL